MPTKRNYEGKWRDIAGRIQPGDSFHVSTRGEVEWARRELKKNGKDSFSKSEIGGFRVYCVKWLRLPVKSTPPRSASQPTGPSRGVEGEEI